MRGNTATDKLFTGLPCLAQTTSKLLLNAVLAMIDIRECKTISSPNDMPALWRIFKPDCINPCDSRRHHAKVVTVQHNKHRDRLLSSGISTTYAVNTLPEKSLESKL
jgi:hypothetical protein